MKSDTKIQHAPTVAATIFGEDIGCGDYIALLNETFDVPSYMWDSCGVSLAPDELVRLQLIPGNAGQPLKVIGVCLPFVYAKTPDGATETIDVRRVQLVRLDRRCAKSIWKNLRPKSRKKKRQSKR
jgi:hypothetical protein